MKCGPSCRSKAGEMPAKIGKKWPPLLFSSGFFRFLFEQSLKLCCPMARFSQVFPDVNSTDLQN